MNETNKRIARNTIMLYIRMIVVMIVSLYTTRVVLHILGANDFGIYSVISSFVLLFSFINTALITTTQRFINFEIGQGSEENAQRAFSISLLINLGIAFCIIFFGELIGLWYLNRYLNIPHERQDAAFWVFQYALLTMCVQVLRSPYNAAIIASEKMSFYAYISIIEAIFKLAILLPLFLSCYDKLILYSQLMFFVSAAIASCYVFYCYHKIRICKLRRDLKKSQIKEILYFSGWSILGCVADVGSVQGLNLLLNYFISVIINASLGIGLQVMNAINLVASNFQMAFRPQIIKTYACGEKKAFLCLVYRSSKISYYLLLLVVAPFILGAKTLMTLWLGSPPDFSVEISQILLCYILIDAISAPLWMSAQAAGNIKNYQLIISFSILMVLPITYFMLRNGASVIAVIIVKVALNVINMIVRLLYLHYRIKFPVNDFIRKVLFPLITLTTVVVLEMWGLAKTQKFFPLNDYIKMMACFVFTALTIVTIGLSKTERKIIIDYICRK